MRVISWNVWGLRKGGTAVAASLLAHRPSIIALQEYPFEGETPAFESEMTKAGFRLVTGDCRPSHFRTVIFSHETAERRPLPAQLPQDAPYWSEIRTGMLGLSALHIPLNAYPDARKAYWNAALERAKTQAAGRHLIIGDFNTTRHGIDEVGSVVSGDHYLRSLEDANWQEAWRTCHPESREYSWSSSSGNGFRFDQAWLSPNLAPRLQDAYMDHDVRKQKISDHSMLVVDLNAQ